MKCISDVASGASTGSCEMNSHEPPPPLPPGPARISSDSRISSASLMAFFLPSRKTLMRPEQLLVVTNPSWLLISRIKGLIGSSIDPLGDRSVYSSSGTLIESKIRFFFDLKRLCITKKPMSSTVIACDGWTWFRRGFSCCGGDSTNFWRSTRSMWLRPGDTVTSVRAPSRHWAQAPRRPT